MSSSLELTKPLLLAPEFHERVWGSHELRPLFPNSPHKVGEVWFPDPDSGVLVKFLFTMEDLSVQVHPDDVLARQLGYARGKTEMWHILRAGPAARIALGFVGRPSLADVRRAAMDGSIVEMLRWIPVRAGDSWFIPAGAVHAVGAGITLCEVQQHSDITYRLFDYGRGRGLHIEESIRALDLAFEPEPIDQNSQVLADCPFFKVERIAVSGEFESADSSLVIALKGSGTLNGEPFTQGNVGKLIAGEKVRVTGDMQILTVATKT